MGVGINDSWGKKYQSTSHCSQLPFQFSLHITWYLEGISLMLGTVGTTSEQGTITTMKCRNPLAHEFEIVL